MRVWFEGGAERVCVKGVGGVHACMVRVEVVACVVWVELNVCV